MMTKISDAIYMTTGKVTISEQNKEAMIFDCLNETNMFIEMYYIM